MIEPLAWILLGCFLGVFTGLVPGIHVNTLSILILLFASSSDFNFVLLIVAMSIMHSFVDFIPSIALGAPDSDSFLSILPGHRFLLKGRGFYAVKLTIFGGLFGGIISSLSIPIFILFVIKLVSFIYSLIPLILIFVLILMVLGEKGAEKRKWALIVIILSSCLGLLSLKVYSFQNALFPLVTGFFGSATLIYSINKKHAVKKQIIGKDVYGKKTVFEGSVLSALAGGIVALLPSIGPSQAAFIIRKLVGRISSRNYLVILGGINTSNMIFSFLVLYLIGKARTGSAAAIKQIIALNETHLYFIIAAIIISVGLGAIATELIAKNLFKIIHTVNYKKLNSLVLALLILLTFILSGFLGLATVAVATTIGLMPLASKIKRTNCMAFLVIPTILFYLGL